MENYIKFTDFFKMSYELDESEDPKKKKDLNLLRLLFPSNSRRYRAKNDNVDPIVPRVLGVKIAATHSGRVTDNMGFYLPDKMQKGANSWLEPFAKPILLHHDTSDDAIGRVRNANYIDVSTGFKRRSDWMKRADKIIGDYPSDVLIDAFVAGKLTPQESVDVVRNVFLIKDYNFTRDPSYPGLGYIELTAAISDSDSIQKIIDERFLTGSIGARSSAAVCSVCKKDWLKERCEHSPGKTYKDILCVVIAGDLLYDEYSYVNRPADSLSRNIEVFMDGQRKDSVECFCSGVGDDKIPEVCFNITDSIIDLSQEEGDSMDQEETKGEEEVKEEVQEEKVDEEVVEDPLKVELGDLYDEVVGENPDESDLFYAQMVADVKMGRLGLSEDETSAFLDAKLTSKSRKALATSTFCKPSERKYPVPDCCLTYETRIRLLDGRDVQIGDMVGMLERGDEIWVYGFDLNKMAIVPAQVSKAWKARENAPLLKIELDSGEEILCTGNHPFLMRDGSYISADKLEISQSVMPFYAKKDAQHGAISPDQLYDKIYQPLNVECNNHFIVSIEEVGHADVYDIEVPATENFALSAGIFVHNSHARSAMAYAKKYNESSSVIACIKRKAKRLGCPFSDEQDLDTIGVFTLDWFDTYSDEELVQMDIGLDAAMKERDIERQVVSGEDNSVDCVAIQNKMDEFKNDIQKAHDDNTILRDQLLSSNKENRRIRASHILALRLLSGDPEIVDKTDEERNALLDDLMSRSLEDLEKIEESIKKQVDPEVVGNLLGKGLSANPSTVVEDPTLRYTDDRKGGTVRDNVDENNEVVDKKEVVVDNNYIEKIQEDYVYIRMEYGHEAAEQFLEDLKEKGFISKENPFRSK